MIDLFDTIYYNKNIMEKSSDKENNEKTKPSNKWPLIIFLIGVIGSTSYISKTQSGAQLDTVDVWIKTTANLLMTIGSLWLVARWVSGLFKKSK